MEKLCQIGAAVWRRVRLQWLRLRFPRARFGARCDVRSGLKLRLKRGAHFEVGDSCVLDHDLTVECAGTLRIGHRVIFGHHCTLAAIESLEIGDDALIAEMVSIRDHDHAFSRLDVPIRTQGAVSSPTRIGKNVWLGAKVTVLRGVTIGDNTIVGANAVVTKDLPADVIAVGIPARVIRSRRAEAAP